MVKSKSRILPAALIALAVLTASVFMCVPAETNAAATKAVKSGFVKEKGKTYYYKSGKKVKATTIKYKYSNYYFNARSGALQCVKGDLYKLIDQKKTAFGRSGCGGASALMALQAKGYKRGINKNNEYRKWWNKCAYHDGIGLGPLVSFAKRHGSSTTKSAKGASVKDVQNAIWHGRVAIVLVKKGPRNGNHWVVAYGYNNSTTNFHIADPWGGKHYTKAKKELNKWMKAVTHAKTQVLYVGNKVTW